MKKQEAHESANQSNDFEQNLFGSGLSGLGRAKNDLT